jgi:uncharacterized membrane protein YbhN (UPF0104 family)
VTGLRLYLVGLALGFNVTVAQAAALTVSAVLATATGFFPGGLGIRELLAAGVSPLVRLSSLVGIAVSAVDRLGTLCVLVPLSAYWLRRTAEDLPKDTSA